jgi:putative aldouronate transport system substrate-binding protein
MKRTLLLILVLVMITLAAGCGPQVTGTQPTTTPAQKGASSDDTAPADAAPEPITFTMYNVETDAYPDTDFSSPVAQEIKKATGVTLEIENAVSSDAGKQKLSLMAASGDYPDFVYGKGDLSILKLVDPNQHIFLS